LLDELTPNGVDTAEHKKAGLDQRPEIVAILHLPSAHRSIEVLPDVEMIGSEALEGFVVSPPDLHPAH